MKRILLAVITEADVCSASFCAALTQSVKIGLGADVEFFPVFLSAEGNWSMAFNQGITIVWEQKLDGFVCISPRVSWAPESLLSLVNSTKDAVVIPVATRNGFSVNIGEVARLQEDEDSGEIKVLGASLEFIYLSPYTVNRLCQTHPTVSYKDQNIKLILQSGDIYNSYFDPGDILTYRLREQGIELWASSRLTAYRQDSVEYTADFSEVLTNLKKNG